MKCIPREEGKSTFGTWKTGGGKRNKWDEFGQKRSSKPPYASTSQAMPFKRKKRNKPNPTAHQLETLVSPIGE
jgi:hypothetical protein